MTPGDQWNPRAGERQESEQNERNAAASGSEPSPVSLLGQKGHDSSRMCCSIINAHKLYRVSKVSPTSC